MPTDPRIIGAVLTGCLFLLLKYAFGVLGLTTVVLAFVEGSWTLYIVGIAELSF